MAPIRDPRDSGARTIALLAERYGTDHLAGLSLRYKEKQEYVLRRWILPHLGPTHVTRWTPAESNQQQSSVLSAKQAAPTRSYRTSVAPCGHW